MDTERDKMSDFMNDVLSTPVYVIAAHSCIMNPMYAKETGAKPYFKVPKDTLIVSFGAPGDFICTDNETIQTLHTNLKDIRKFMYVHSASDVIERKKKKKEHSLFGEMKRAAAKTPYPNICYDLNNIDKERPTRRAYNKYGVYRLDTLKKEDIPNLTNARSVLEHDIDRDAFNLHSIIKDVYEKTGIKKGIFISLGCLSPYQGKATAHFMDKAERVYEDANTLYNTMMPTLTKEDILKYFDQDALPNDVLIDYAIANWAPTVVEKMVKDDLLVATACFNIVHRDDLKRLQKRIMTTSRP